MIAGVHIWPQATTLREKAKSLGIKNLQVEKLDILDPYDVENALQWDIDILINNAAIGYAGAVAEIPLELVHCNFETNLFGTLNVTQKYVRKFIDNKQQGKIVFVSSIAGLLTAPGYAPYCATKHALEAIAEALYVELKPFNIQVQTINPGAFKTGFNNTMAETASHWMNDAKNFTKTSEMTKLYNNILDNQMDPQLMIDAMIEIIPAPKGKFRNVFPEVAANLVKKYQMATWEHMI